MSFGWFLGLSIASLIFFAASFVFSSRNYKRRFKETYDMRNHFPYEFNFESSFSENILGNITLLFSLSFAVGLFALIPTYIKNNGMLFYVLISGIVFALMVGVIHFIPLKLLKTHLIFSVLLFAASFATPAAIGLTALKEYQLHNEVGVLVFMIVSFVIAGFAFLMIMNPKMSLNIKMNIATDDKGNEVYLRPKYIVFALSEWILIYILLISEILTVILIKLL